MLPALTSLPWDIIAVVAELLENRDLARCWRVSRLWRKIFRSDIVCGPALRTILEPECPNYAAHLALPDQLAYHERRLDRFRRSNPWGKTAIHLGYQFYSGTQEYVFKEGDGPNGQYLIYSNGRLAWFEWARSSTSDGSEYEWICFVKVHCPIDGELLVRHIPTAHCELLLSYQPITHYTGYISLSNRLVAVLVYKEQLQLRKCYTWALEDGEERSLDLPFAAEAFMIVHEWLIGFRPTIDDQQTMLFWNVQANTYKIIRLDNPILTKDPRTYFVPDGTAVIHYAYSNCNTSYGTVLDCSCQNHEAGEVTGWFLCAKTAIEDGTLLSFQKYQHVHKDSIFKPVPYRQIQPSNRDGLFNLGSLDQAYIGDTPLMGFICQYSMKDDRLSLKHYKAPPFPFKERPAIERDMHATRWKDTIFHQIVVSDHYRWVFWTKVGRTGQETDGRWIGPYDGYDGALLWADDVHAITCKKNVVHVHWYDKLAYLKARDNTRSRYAEKKKKNNNKKKKEEEEIKGSCEVSMVESTSEQLDKLDLQSVLAD